MRKGRVRVGAGMVAASWRLLRDDLRLLVVASLIYGGAVVLLLGAVALVDGFAKLGSDAVMPKIPFAVAGGILLSFASAFATATMCAAISDRLSGGNGAWQSGVAVAWAHRGPLARWAMVQLWVGLGIRLLTERLPLGWIASWLAEATWAVASMLAIPVIIAEPDNAKPSKALRRSVALINLKFGPGVSGFVLTHVPMVAAFALFLVAVPLATAVGPDGAVFVASVFGLGLLALGIVTSGLTTVFRSVLYHHATGGALPDGLRAADFDTRS